MDFLDPKKQRTHMIRLIVGYVLIGVAIVIATIVLLYQAYGFGLDRKGEIIQNGLIFVSSQPNGARVYLNGKLENNTTNTKLQVPGGTYKLELQREGYHSWERKVNLEGGSVEHFDYPLLFPAEPVVRTVASYNQSPGLSTASPDRRWLLVQQSASLLNFDVYDLSDPEQVVEQVTRLALPQTVLAASGVSSGSWELVEWANNNRHVVLAHRYEGGLEYVLVDRTNPEESVNLTELLNLQAGETISLRDKKADRYYIYNEAARTLIATTNAPDAVRQPIVNGLLAFESYGSDKILYVTETGAANGKVNTMLLDGETTYKIREHPAGSSYLLGLVRYDGNWIVTTGAAADNRVYVYKNPQAIRKAGKQEFLVPLRVLKVQSPNYLAFSSNTQLLMVQGGNAFATYDIENDRSYDFTTTEPLDAPAQHATWMDGHRIVYVSGGKLVVFDYDNTNRRTIAIMNAGTLPFFDRDYRNLYVLRTDAGAPGAPSKTVLSGTSLLTPADL